MTCSIHSSSQLNSSKLKIWDLRERVSAAATTYDASPQQQPSVRPNTMQLQPPQQVVPARQAPKPLPLQGTNALSSAHIPKEMLQNPSSVLARNKKLQIESKAPTLALRLARDSFFREEVMAQCTPSDVGTDLPYQEKSSTSSKLNCFDYA